MENNEQRNEIIRIFRKYERLGLSSKGLNPIQIYKKIDVLCVSRRSKLDMLAVFDTLRMLALQNDTESLEILYRVYFCCPEYRLTKIEMGRRVALCARETFCDERTVYRRLERIRKICFQIRQQEGLLWDGVSPYSLRKIVEKMDKTTKK